MKFWSNLGLVRTLKLGEFKENRSLSFRDIGVRDSRRHTQYGQYGAIFKLAVRILESFETNEILVKLRTGQDLETGRGLKKIVRSVFEISVFRESRRHTQYGQYGPFSS